MNGLRLPLTRPGELRCAGVGAGFADHAIAPGRFGEIKPSVGALEESLIIGVVFGACGKPDAHRDQWHVGFHMARDVAADALAECERCSAGQFVGDHHEFLAAEPEYGVAGPHRRSDDAHDPLQHDVAGGMAEAVVEALEMIDVDDEQAQRPAGQRRLLDTLSAQMLEPAAIERAGQRVASGAGQ